MWHHEGCFLFIWLEHEDLVVLGECVYKGEHPMSGSEVNYLINLGQRKTILRASVVQIGVINTDSPFFTFLQNNHHVRQPIQIFNFPDKPSC